MTKEQALNNLKEALEHSDIPMRDTLLESFYLLHPELAEKGADEKMLDAILCHVKASNDFTANGVNKEDMVAYLEKQKEQKPILKFKVGDKIHLIDGTSPNYEDDCITIREIGTVNYIGEFKEGYVPIKEQDKWELVKEHKHYWKPTKTDVALLDKAVTTNKALTPVERAQLDIIRSKFGCCRAVNCSGIVQEDQKPEERFEEAREKYQVEWSEEDKDYYDTIVRKLEVIGDDSGLSDNQIKFLREHCPLNCSEWSEEDEKIRQSIIKDIEFERNYTYATTGKVSEKYNEQINWLKVLSLNRKKINEDVEKLCSNEWSDEDEDMFNDILLDMADRREMFKSKGETTFAENTQKKIDWLDSHHIQLKYSSCPQPKQEWSDRDEQILEFVFGLLDNLVWRRDWEISQAECSEWLVKALKPSWKPSEEQMEALAHAINCYESDWGENKLLRILINDLKKRM